MPQTADIMDGSSIVQIEMEKTTIVLQYKKHFCYKGYIYLISACEIALIIFVSDNNYMSQICVFSFQATIFY